MHREQETSASRGPHPCQDTVRHSGCGRCGRRHTGLTGRTPRNRPGTGSTCHRRGSSLRDMPCTPSASPPGSALNRPCGRTSGRARHVKALFAGDAVRRLLRTARAVRVARLAVFVQAEVPALTHGAPATARLQDNTARVSEFAARRGVGRLVGDQRRPVVAGGAVGRRAKVLVHDELHTSHVALSARSKQSSYHWHPSRTWTRTQWGIASPTATHSPPSKNCRSRHRRHRPLSADK